ncbi:hypothetical protein PISMIDRAFT_97377 [Pisolithus microcarpus 441]|uniref:DDE-1 domain-containing protein n=1 Tax=Pisolithus microcarpus 441 TaxID=765257 RepID=A0A0C9YJH9_9AGAM|nr:hypothetical protein PISMIDRAFT_97377 [Pisolithus microcarpus 441]
MKYRTHSGNLELVTIIECMSADGSSIAPGFVFSGKSYHKKWFKAHPDICVGTSPNGWTDDFICTKWFENTFIPQATA